MQRSVTQFGYLAGSGSRKQYECVGTCGHVGIVAGSVTDSGRSYGPPTTFNCHDCDMPPLLPPAGLTSAQRQARYAARRRDYTDQARLPFADPPAADMAEAERRAGTTQ